MYDANGEKGKISHWCRKAIKLGVDRDGTYKGMKPRDAVSYYERSIFYFRDEVDRCRESVRIFGKIRPDYSRPQRLLRAAEKKLRDSERFLVEALAAAAAAPSRLPSTEHKKLPARLRSYYLQWKRDLATIERGRAEKGEDYDGRARRILEKMASPGATFPYPPRPREGAPWILAHAMIALMEEKEEGLDLLYRSFYYQAADFYCAAASYMGTEAPFLSGTDFNRGAFLLAEALTLGCWSDAARIATVTRFALAQRRRSEGQLVCGFRVVERTCVAPFVLNLYAQWSGNPFPLEDLPLLSMQLYEPLLSVWQTEDLGELEEALLSACDFHMERSSLRENSSPEFNIPKHILHPVEILAVLRLREAKGLINPEIDHPLMHTPLGRLHEIKSVPHDEMLDRAVANYLSTLPDYVTEQLFS